MENYSGEFGVGRVSNRAENLEATVSDGSWGWLLATGVVTCLLGLFAYMSVMATTIASMFVLGALVLGAAAMQVAAAVTGRHWQGITLHSLLAVLYVLAGLMFITRPIMAAESMTMFLGLFLILSGVFRIVGSFTARSDSRLWVFATGVISSLLGGMILAAWPVTGLFAIGLFVGIDLVFLGLYLIRFAFAVRKDSVRFERSDAVYN